MSRRRLVAPLALSFGALIALHLFGTVAAVGDASSSGSDAARVSSAPEPRAAPAPVRVLVYHDMEGVSGQDDWRTFLFPYREQYARGRELLTADLNAVIDGLFAGGATQVDVLDAHGSTNPEPDVRRDLLDRRARQYTRDAPFDVYLDPPARDAYDAIAVVAMHAKTGSRGFASHTETIGMDVILNGKSVSETELVGFSWGRYGVPVIFASGDDRLQSDLRTMPWLEYVVTKRATSASTVELRAPVAVHAEMREKAARAVRNRSRARAMTLATPVRAALRAQSPASLASLDGVPGITLVGGNRVDFTAPDFPAAYRGVMALIGVATSGYEPLLVERLRRRPDGDAIMRDYLGALITRMMDVESGRYTPPAARPPAAGTKYHGAR